MSGSAGHLLRRFAGSLSRREPVVDDVAWAHRVLPPGAAELWDSMPVADRRHSLVVARRFVTIAPDAPPAAVAGALLHDVGKVDCRLGTLGRVVATVVGPRGRRFRRYHDHEAIGVELAAAVGCPPETLAVMRGLGPYGGQLRAADDI